MGNCYWGKFIKKGNNMFRLDTRIYLMEVDKPSDNDICIGALAGKNPGSAIPYDESTENIQPIKLDGDNLLPTVKSIFSKSYKNANKTILPNYYIQILNTMYLCDKDLSSAINKISNCTEKLICETEKKSFPFIWYVWGNSDKNLNEFKKRFFNIKVNNHFYYNTNEKKIINNAPSLTDPARHTQGLSHDLVIPFISEIL